MSECPFPPGASVWAYLRDSGGTGQERSVQQQRAIVEAYCQQHHLVLARVYADEAAPGSSVIGRDQFLEMVGQLRRLAPERGPRDWAAPDGVLYWDIKRFARDQDDGAFYRADLRRRGYLVRSLSDEIPSGDLAPVFEALLGWKAEQDLRDLSKDVRRGLHALVTTRDDEGRYVGLHPNRPPVGFRSEPYPVGSRRDGTPRIAHRWVPDRGGTWELVQKAFEMRAAGASHLEIHQATHLHQNLNSYSPLFKRRIYTGDLEYGGRVYENWCEPCVSRGVWEAVQARRKPPGQQKPRLGTTSYTLSGWLRCGEPGCGAAVTGTTSSRLYKGKTYSYRQYHCTAARNKQAHKGCYFRADRLEAVIYDLLVEEVLTPETLYTALVDVRLDGEEAEALARQLSGLEAQRGAVDRKIEQLLAAIEQGGHLPALVERLGERQAEQAALALEIMDVHNRMAQEKPEVTRDLLADFCRNTRAILDHGDAQTVRGLIGSIVTKIVVKNDKTGELWYTLPLDESGQEHVRRFTWD